MLKSLLEEEGKGVNRGEQGGWGVFCHVILGRVVIHKVRLLQSICNYGVIETLDTSIFLSLFLFKDLFFAFRIYFFKEIPL